MCVVVVVCCLVFVVVAVVVVVVVVDDVEAVLFVCTCGLVLRVWFWIARFGSARVVVGASVCRCLRLCVCV